MKNKILLGFILYFLHCDNTPHKETFEKKDSFLPSEVQVSQVIHSKSDFRILDDYAKSLGFKGAWEYHSKIISDISDEEFQFYYNKYKPSGIQNLGIEVLASERKKILNRIAWYKIINAVNLKIEIKNLDFTNVDLKKISIDDEPSTGNQFAKVTVIEFSDFNCYYCSLSQSVSIDLRKKYGNKIYWVFKDFPTQDIQDDGFQSHIAANCVNQIQPEKYWEYFHLLFENYQSLEKENLLYYAVKIKINQEKWKECMENRKLQKQIISEIQGDIKEGKQIGVKGTPTFIINGKRIVGARGYEFFDAVIGKELY